MVNFLDDFAGCERPPLAQKAFSSRSVLSKAGIVEAEDKACSPSVVMEFLGVLFNTLSMYVYGGDS